MESADTDHEARTAGVRAKLHRLLPHVLLVLIPFLLLVVTGWRGLDFGMHWDERPWQIGPVKRMVQTGTLLPGAYHYPAFDYWLNLATLIPDALGPRPTGVSLDGHLGAVVDDAPYLLRLRAIYLVFTSLTVVWVYLLVARAGRSRGEAFLAAALLACSWEAAYHLRWVASDGVLMQFAALTALLALEALQRRRAGWLLAAAAAAGLGCATKYPGGLLLLPVLLAGWQSAGQSGAREKRRRLGAVLTVFALVVLALNPALVLQPREVLRDIELVMHSYSAGHGGHTIDRGFEHAGRMLGYFALELFSPHAVIAAPLFALAVLGGGWLVAREPRRAGVLLIFPVCYALYFSAQGVMIVRNLLAVAPFLAICAARGAGVLGERIHDHARWPHPRAWRPAASAALLLALPLAGALGANALWLIDAAERIVDRRTDRFVRELAGFVREQRETTFLLSPRVRLDLARVTAPLPNVTDDPAAADAVVLYVREGMRSWQDWPANHVGLADECFGPREVNFDVYPNWWGDDRIVVFDADAAREIGLRLVGFPAKEKTPPVGAQGAVASAAALEASNALLTDADAAQLMGPLAQGPVDVGWELNGAGCTFVGVKPVVVSAVSIPAHTYQIEEAEPESAPVPEAGQGIDAYAVHAGPFGDIRLFARDRRHAVVIHVTANPGAGLNKLELALSFARRALQRLDRAQSSAGRGAAGSS